MLEMREVNSFYGRIQVLRNLTLSVGQGQIVSLLGANGAGKTTTLKTIVGLNRSAANDIRFDGKPLAKVPPHAMVSLGIALVPERREIFPQLSVVDNLEMGAYSRRDRNQIRADIDRTYDLFPALGELRHSPGGTLSGGQQQMLAIGRAMMSRPRMLLLDEPTLGLSPLLVDQIFKTLALLNRDGITMLLVEQNAYRAFDISSYAYILENGHIVKHGPTSELRHDPAVQEAYLGAV